MTRYLSKKSEEEKEEEKEEESEWRRWMTRNYKNTLCGDRMVPELQIILGLKDSVFKFSIFLYH